MTRHRLPYVLCVLAALAFSFAGPARADDFEVSFGIEPGGPPAEYDGRDLDAGLFAGFGVRFSELWTGEVRWLTQDGDAIDVDTLHFGVRRHLPNGSAWTPFAQGGLHYADRSVHAGRGLRDEDGDFGVFAGGGVDWKANDTLSLRFDGRLLLYDSDTSGGLESDVDLTAGVVFRF